VNRAGVTFKFVSPVNITRLVLHLACGCAAQRTNPKRVAPNWNRKNPRHFHTTLYNNSLCAHSHFISSTTSCRSSMSSTWYVQYCYCCSYCSWRPFCVCWLLPMLQYNNHDDTPMLTLLSWYSLQIVLDNPSLFQEKFSFEITFECLAPLDEDLEWNVVYVGSAESCEYDQILQEVQVSRTRPPRRTQVCNRESSTVCGNITDYSRSDSRTSHLYISWSRVCAHWILC